MPPPRSAEFVRRLLAWYNIHQRKLPWRRTRDPYRIWISEVMLQQTTVETVISYYGRWLTRFPNLKALARSSLFRVLKSWQGLGYYQRARNLWAAARVVVRDHGGQLPTTYRNIAGLPGIGPSTASAVLSFAFGQALPVVEANVRRVMMRLLRLAGQSSPALDKRLREHLQKIMPRRRAGLFNQALMELGALVCRPVSPRCLACPIRAHCLAYGRGEQEIIPRPRKREALRLTAAVAVIRQNGKVLIQKRPEQGLLAGLWEFPGGKLRPGETAPEALRREIKEELGVVVKNMRFLARVKHAYTKFRVDLNAYLCELAEALRPDRRRRWVRTADLRRYPFPSGSARIVDRLEEMDRTLARKGRPSGRACRNL